MYVYSTNTFKQYLNRIITESFHFQKNIFISYDCYYILRNKSKLSFSHNYPKPWNSYIRITLFFHISNLRYLVLPRTHNPLEIQLVDNH